MKLIKHKKDIAYELSLKHHLTIDQSCKALDIILDKINEEILKKNKVNIVNFGAFITKKHKEKKGRNPKTGDIMTLPERWAYFFKVSKNCFLNK